MANLQSAEESTSQQMPRGQKWPLTTVSLLVEEGQIVLSNLTKNSDGSERREKMVLHRESLKPLRLVLKIADTALTRGPQRFHFSPVRVPREKTWYLRDTVPLPALQCRAPNVRLEVARRSADRPLEVVEGDLDWLDDLWGDTTVLSQPVPSQAASSQDPGPSCAYVGTPEPSSNVEWPSQVRAWNPQQSYLQYSLNHWATYQPGEGIDALIRAAVEAEERTSDSQGQTPAETQGSEPRFTNL